MKVEVLVNAAIDSITRQRFALAEIRKEIPLSRTDIEVLAFAKRIEIFNVYQLVNFYPVTNVQQLRASVQRLHKHKLVELLKAGVKNKPAVYCISYSGEKVLNSFLLKIL
jgi:hypothetical protein